MQDVSLGAEKMQLIALLRKHGVVLKGGNSQSGARLVDELLVGALYLSCCSHAHGLSVKLLGWLLPMT